MPDSGKLHIQDTKERVGDKAHSELKEKIQKDHFSTSVISDQKPCLGPFIKLHKLRHKEQTV